MNKNLYNLEIPTKSDNKEIVLSLIGLIGLVFYLILWLILPVGLGFYIIQAMQ